MRTPNCTLPIVVLGVLDTPRGREISERMQDWIERSGYYDVHIYMHNGEEYERPALEYAQRISSRECKPVLYLHTRGAVNIRDTTEYTHRMWEAEFGKMAQYYASLINSQQSPCVIAPIVDNRGTHRYNGFVANTAAWLALDEIPRYKDRHEYEHLWRGTDTRILGTLMHSEDNRLKEIHKYLKEHYGK